MTASRLTIVRCVGVLALLSACGDDASDEGAADAGFDAAGQVLTNLDAAVPDAARVDSGFDWQLPKNFPLPAVPANNPMTAEKVALGRFLFYDERLSQNQTFSCASCHKQELAFSDGRATGLGSTNEGHPRGSMSLANIAYSPTLTWANPLMTELERQARVPIFGDMPIELGIVSVKELEQRIQAVPGYVRMFAEAFPSDPAPISVGNLLNALSAFERTLISGDSPYDRWLAGDEGAISEAAKRGHQLFNTERLECFHCHSGFAMTNHATWADKAFTDAPFHQTGLYNLDGRGAYPEPNRGVYETSLDPRDMGKFKAPTLRNIALTAPYMHDGSIATLPEVLDHYAKGGRAHSFRTDTLLVGFELAPNEVADVIAFLESLTDQGFLTNPRFSDPGTVQ
jgi:cytochrome c peroxidase